MRSAALAAAVEAVHAPQRPGGLDRLGGARGSRSSGASVPLDSVGIYVPAGRAPLASSLVMTAVPARVAGVRRIAVATPRPHPAVLATARELGIDEVYAVGGAQAVAAFAYGTESVPRVDKIVGPGEPLGDRGEAARLEHGRDRPARRAERGARRRRRHRRREGVRSRPARPGRARTRQRGDPGHDQRGASRTTSPRRCGRPCPRRGGRLARRRRSPARTSTRPSTSSCSSPTPRRARHEVVNAGAVFLGTTAVLGDYAAGANHVLPTGGLARGAGGLGLEAFLKPVQYVRASREGLDAVRGDGRRARRPRGSPAARRRGRGATRRTRRPLAEGFEPYVWASTAEEVAARRGLRPAR